MRMRSIIHLLYIANDYIYYSSINSSSSSSSLSPPFSSFALILQIQIGTISTSSMPEKKKLNCIESKSYEDTIEEVEK